MIKRAQVLLLSLIWIQVAAGETISLRPLLESMQVVDPGLREGAMLRSNGPSSIHPITLFAVSPDMQWLALRFHTAWTPPSGSPALLSRIVNGVPHLQRELKGALSPRFESQDIAGFTFLDQRFLRMSVHFRIPDGNLDTGYGSTYQFFDVETGREFILSPPSGLGEVIQADAYTSRYYFVTTLNNGKFRYSILRHDPATNTAKVLLSTDEQSFAYTFSYPFKRGQPREVHELAADHVEVVFSSFVLSIKGEDVDVVYRPEGSPRYARPLAPEVRGALDKQYLQVVAPNIIAGLSEFDHVTGDLRLYAKPRAEEEAYVTDAAPPLFDESFGFPTAYPLLQKIGAGDKLVIVKIDDHTLGLVLRQFDDQVVRIPILDANYRIETTSSGVVFKFKDIGATRVYSRRDGRLVYADGPRNCGLTMNPEVGG